MRAIARSLLTTLALTALLGGVAACGADQDGGGGPAGGAEPSATSPGRAEVTPAPGAHTLTLTWAGADRTALLHAPPSYRPGTPVPLVVALHGNGQSVDGLRADSGLDALADQKGFLVAYPSALGSGFSALSCCGGVDDVGFIRALVGELTGRWSVDPDRIYATGYSIGAEMAYKLGVEAADVFAAIAPVSGAFRGGRASADPGYKPSRPVSLITFIGYDDRNATAMYTGLAQWQRNLGCRVGKPAWVGEGRRVNRTVSSCPDGSEVVDYTVNDLGHAWPSATGAHPTIDASAVIWDFFAAHPRRS